MFNPTRDQVRDFFIATRRKQRQAEALSPIETMAGAWIGQHPEYFALLDADHAAESVLVADVENPFLHLSMHLAIDEQTSIDQPPGIRDAVSRLASKLGELHAAHHEVMECLGEMLWTAQRNSTPPDGTGYVECIERRLG